MSEKKTSDSGGSEEVFAVDEYVRQAGDWILCALALVVFAGIVTVLLTCYLWFGLMTAQDDIRLLRVQMASDHYDSIGETGLVRDEVARLRVRLADVEAKLDSITREKREARQTWYQDGAEDDAAELETLPAIEYSIGTSHVPFDRAYVTRLHVGEFDAGGVTVGYRELAWLKCWVSTPLGYDRQSRERECLEDAKAGRIK